MKNLKVKKNGRGGLIVSFTLTTQKEMDYLAGLLNYAPTRILPLLAPENKTIDEIRDALSSKGADCHKGCELVSKACTDFFRVKT